MSKQTEPPGPPAPLLRHLLAHLERAPSCVLPLMGKRTGVLRVVLLALLLAGAAQASPRWYVELPVEIADEAATRRALALELSGVVVPPDPLRIGDTSDDVELHISVTLDARSTEMAAWLVVRVWDRGEFAGSKRISSAGHSTTVGRRVALATVELVRHLAAVRTRNLRLEAKREAERETERRQERREAERRRLAVQSDLLLVWATDGAWLAGPGLGLEFNRELPWRFRTGLSVLGGELLGQGAQRDGALSWSWFDAHVGTYFALPLGQKWTGEVGGLLAASLVDVGGGADVDGIPQQTTTWTSRVGVDVGAAARLGPSLRIRLALGAGALLRPIPVTFTDVESRFGGAYLSAQVALLARRP